MITPVRSFVEGEPGDGRRFRTLFHPESYGAWCPGCGGRARWPAVLGMATLAGKMRNFRVFHEDCTKENPPNFASTEWRGGCDGR